MYINCINKLTTTIMSTYYTGPCEYIDEFNINAPIVDTKERDDMCRLWGELAYTKVYLVYGCHEPEEDLYYWASEEVYLTGWEWNEEGNHLHAIGTMRNVNDLDEQQKSHLVYDMNFRYIISEKILKTIVEKETDVQEEMITKEIADILLHNRKYPDGFFARVKSVNNGEIPGMLHLELPVFGDRNY